MQMKRKTADLTPAAPEVKTMFKCDQAALKIIDDLAADVVNTILNHRRIQRDSTKPKGSQVDRFWEGYQQAIRRLSACYKQAIKRL